MKNSFIGEEPDDLLLEPEADLNTYANMKDAKILSYDLSLSLDFDEKMITGKVVIEVESINDLK